MIYPKGDIFKTNFNKIYPKGKMDPQSKVSFTSVQGFNNLRGKGRYLWRDTGKTTNVWYRSWTQPTERYKLSFVPQDKKLSFSLLP